MQLAHNMTKFEPVGDRSEDWAALRWHSLVLGVAQPRAVIAARCLVAALGGAGCAESGCEMLATDGASTGELTGGPSEMPAEEDSGGLPHLADRLNVLFARVPQA